MNWTIRLYIQAAIFGLTGAALAYFFSAKLPTQTVAEMMRTLGNISAIAGSLVGWSVSSIAQSRGLIRDIDYDAAEELFQQLGELQKELIWRWIVIFGCSVVAIACAVLTTTSEPNSGSFPWMFVASSIPLAIAISFVLYLFRQMLALSRLKARLDDFERSELRKKRLLSKVEEG